MSVQSDIICRNATETDVPQILDIYNEIIRNTTAVYDYEPHTLEMRMQWFKTRNDQGFPILIAERINEIIGFGSFGPFRREWTAYRYSVENSVYVKHNYRGMGVGKLLLEPLINEARKLNMHTMLAGIDATNEASISLHKKFGFVEAAHFKEVGYKFNRWLDLAFFQLML